MGSCLGKLSNNQSNGGGGAANVGEICPRSPTVAVTESLTDCGLAQQQAHVKQKRGGNSLEEIVNQLIRETLCVIGSIVENDSEPPYPMVRLHDITERPAGWIQLVASLIEVVPLSHPMAPSVITMLLDDSPLPTKECVECVAKMVSNFKHDYKRVHRERNFCIIIGCLAEKLSGPNSNTLLTDETLGYLITNLETCISKDVTLFSIIALEKFAKTNENKEYIKNKLKSMTKNPLLELEKYADSTQDLFNRQIGFCARWCLDNYFCIEDRKYSYKTVDVSRIHAMLNVRDVSEYLKISPDGIEARCDEYTFESVRCTCQAADTGRWYYEALIITPGVMQIGWATKRSRFLSQEGYGIGDDIYSISFDGCRRLIWYNAKSMAHSLPAWQSGSVLGCLLDLDREEIVFSLNGERTQTLQLIFENVKTGFFAAASFMSFQQCRFNFGTEPFRYAPTEGAFSTFNEIGAMTEADKVILPRHLYLEELRKSSIKENSCTICFDTVASVRIEPCNHRGYCDVCVKQLIDCPMCRGPILSIVPDTSS